MSAENKQIQELTEEVNRLRDQNEKLEITTRFYKLQYEDTLEQMKKKQNELIDSICGTTKYKYHYEYPHPALTADCVVFAVKNDELHVLLIKRGLQPHQGKWALPGGFLRMNQEKEETIEECANRELQEETGLKTELLEQFHVYSEPNRDERERVVTVAFIALVKMNPVKGGDDADHAEWVSTENLPEELAFDHKQIIEDALEELKRIIYFKPVVFDLLPKRFSMRDLKKIYEAILKPEKEFDRGNFQKKMKAQEFIIPVQEEENRMGNNVLGYGLPSDLMFGIPSSSRTRTTPLYEFDPEAYKRFKGSGFKLEF